MVAVGIERVAVQTGFGSLQPGAELTGENLMTQALGGTHVFLVDGEGHPVARRGGRGGLRRNDGGGGERGDGQRVHDGLRGRIGKGGRRAFALL
ncbi:hypothetical protein GCM10010207_58030 [Streptomyces atratus]|nr:hypothetical protein GCM10010207_58030 [Streptomyces atratus]